MLWLKIALFYIGAACVFIPIATAAIKNQESPEETKSKGKYPKKSFVFMMFIGFVVLAFAIYLCII